MMRLDSDLTDWQVPELPGELGEGGREPGLEAVKAHIHRGLSGDAGQLSRVQIAASDWLYDLVRRNVRRGRAFELGEVLSTRRADCLGYARLFSALGAEFRLEMGVVEVLMDNAGRYVPHHVSLLNLADGTRRFLDAWYGSRDISHRILGALVNSQPRDITREQLGDIRDLRGLPETCLEAITLYIRGNRYLEGNRLKKAIECYSAAIELYPGNSRAFYNRAIARERRGDTEGAGADYARALRDDTGRIRVLASTVGLDELIRLDEKGVSEREQAIYLWCKGYQTGECAGYEEIGQKYGISAREVKSIVARVERLCTG